MFFTLFLSFCFFHDVGIDGFDKQATSTTDSVSVCSPIQKWFAAFFGEEKSSLAEVKDLKTVARWRYDYCPNGGENYQNLRKWVQSL